MATRYRVVLVTVPNKREALKLTQGLIDQKLAACVNIVPGLESFYWWKGKVEKAHELLLLIKTHKGLVDNVISFVRENHSAEVSEAIALPVTEGNKAYLDWIGASTNAAAPIKDVDVDLEKEIG